MNLRRQGKSAVYERCFQRQDGEKLWTIISAKPTTDSEGRHNGSFGMISDITARKRAEEALRESQTRFEHLFDNMADGVAMYQAVDDGTDFVFVDLNRAGQSLSKISREAVVGKRITAAFPAVIEMGIVEQKSGVRR
ncbi:MAG: PAS domain-containing protein, partial [Pseudomonadota bacterium]